VNDVARHSQASEGIGADVPRVDGRAKVTGAARYASDQPVSGLAYAFLAVSPQARGKIKRIDARAARTVPGVLGIMTHEHVGKRIRPGKKNTDFGYMGSSIAPLLSSEIHFAGQIIAVTFAETFEAAREAAQKLEVKYQVSPATATFDSPGTKRTNAKLPGLAPTSYKVGDADQAYERAQVKVESWYETPTQHHNPLELFSTVCVWSGDELTVYEGTQNVRGFQHGLAKQLGIKPKQVRFISHYIGGAFGSRGALNQYTALVALGAKRLKRPVKLVVTREQCFNVGTYRAETRQHVKLAAQRDGRLQSFVHEGWELTSRADRYAVVGIESSTRMYACPNIRAKAWNVSADRQTPGFMRAPPETPYLFALESAIDELAYALEIDPVELRRINDTHCDPIHGVPFTSRSLVPCLEEASQAFGWSQRTAAPGSMRDGNWLVGWGCASAAYPTKQGPAAARITLRPDATALVEVGSHEIGTGAYTVIAQTAAEGLGIPLAQIQVSLGDSRLPPAPLAAGSSNTASVCNVVAKACNKVRMRLALSAAGARDSVFHGREPAGLRLHSGELRSADGASEPVERAIARVGEICEYAENTPHGVPPIIGIKLLIARGMPVIAGGGLKDRAQYAFGAHFVEVRVHRYTGEIRVPRAVGAFAAGRILNPRTAKSQLMGGQIWGISAALHEATEIDRERARYYNPDLAEYLIPVNADVRDIQTIMLPERDELVNALGIKGLGELGTVGMNAAVANAVFHATGRRIRKLPIRLEQML
jgi:xanthine dehydrogenase YagR molybdenum-binding subunit